ncbi:arsenic resistance N-acetyltransferase ArsN2, partial [Accumulibacter sp.]|uniref:arsenic resistance N-acetyltransferase ArsN2 n=1 Tax=Accumulibacter sp. TaxID=2053492 RepID=UPI0028C38819
LVARDDRRLIAAAGLQPCGDVVLLRSLAVATTHRRHGLGSRLVEALERRASANRQRQIFLLTTTAQDFFAARGFRPLARETVPPAIAGTAEFRHLCPASAVCMVKTVDCGATP